VAGHTPGEGDPEARRLAVGRLQKLKRMDLAASAGPGQWMIDLEAEPVLRELGTRGDIIKTMHRAFTGCGRDRDIADYVIDAEPLTLGEVWGNFRPQIQRQIYLKQNPCQRVRASLCASPHF
jgi:hypothetical protein